MVLLNYYLNLTTWLFMSHSTSSWAGQKQVPWDKDKSHSFSVWSLHLLQRLTCKSSVEGVHVSGIAWHLRRKNRYSAPQPYFFSSFMYSSPTLWVNSKKTIFLRSFSTTSTQREVENSPYGGWAACQQGYVRLEESFTSLHGVGGLFIVPHCGFLKEVAPRYQRGALLTSNRQSDCWFPHGILCRTLQKFPTAGLRWYQSQKDFIHLQAKVSKSEQVRRLKWHPHGPAFQGQERCRGVVHIQAAVGPEAQDSAWHLGFE